MRGKVCMGLVAALATGLFLAGVMNARDGQRTEPKSSAGPDGQVQNQGGTDKGREADAEAIRKASRDFVDAFAREDAKAIAALWTAQGEYQSETGDVARGQAALEALFREHFKAMPKGKIEINIESIRFTSPDCAIEQGMLRQVNNAPALPASSFYSVVHVRENGQWKMALAKEWGAGQDRLEDLQWLLGTWKGAANDAETTMSFAWDKTKPFIMGQFSTKAKGKVVNSGTIKIGLDPQRNQLRSWHFDDDGGHGQALWLRDGNRWVLDAVGVLGNGAATDAVNILTRVSETECTWRSIDRVAGNEALPDTAPIKLTLVPAAK